MPKIYVQGILRCDFYIPHTPPIPGVFMRFSPHTQWLSAGLVKSDPCASRNHSVYGGCYSIQASCKVTVSEASISVDVDGSLPKCLVLSWQGDGCRIEAQVRFLSIPSVFYLFSRFSSNMFVSS